MPYLALPAAASCVNSSMQEKLDPDIRRLLVREVEEHERAHLW